MIRYRASFLIYGFSVLFILAGCATPERSILLGAGFGAAVGTGVGLGVEKSPGSALIGAAVGLVAGGVLFFLGHKKQDPVSVKTEAMTPAANGGPPTLTVPEVQKIWSPEKAEGNRFEEGHWIYFIQRPNGWSR